MGTNMSVSQAKFEMKGEVFQPKQSANKKSRKVQGDGRLLPAHLPGGLLLLILDRRLNHDLLPPWMLAPPPAPAPQMQLEKLEKRLAWGGFDDKQPADKVTVILKGVFSPDEFQDNLMLMGG